MKHREWSICSREINQGRTDVESRRKSVSDTIAEWRTRLDKAEGDLWFSAQILRWLAELYERDNNGDDREKDPRPSD